MLDLSFFCRYNRDRLREVKEMKEYVLPDNVHRFGLTFAPNLPTTRNVIAKTIKEKGLSYKDAAARIGISRQALDSFSTGELQPTIEVALKLSLLLDTPVNQLFELERGAWFTSAKDKDGYSIYYDHLKKELISGDAMKGVKKNLRYDKDHFEMVTLTSYNSMIRQAEKERVEEVLKRDGKDAHNRDTLAREKEDVRQKLNKQYPNRYEPMYRELEAIE